MKEFGGVSLLRTEILKLRLLNYTDVSIMRARVEMASTHVESRLPIAPVVERWRGEFVGSNASQSSQSLNTRFSERSFLRNNDGVLGFPWLCWNTVARKQSEEGRVFPLTLSQCGSSLKEVCHIPHPSDNISQVVPGLFVRAWRKAWGLRNGR